MMQPKPISESRTIISVVAQPRDSNHYGVMHGATIMRLVDEAAYAAATRHARLPVVTVCVDHLTFLRPIHIGDVAVIKASVNYVGRTSMEIGVRIETERLATGEVEHVGSGYLTMVAIDQSGSPIPVPPLLLETDDDRRRHCEAQGRREQQLTRAGRGC
ncbi:MAG: acyl-CoA thioesterase [Armatimonadota bacterium]